MPQYDPIFALPPAIALDGTEKIPLDQAGTTRYGTVDQIAARSLSRIPAAIEYVSNGNGGNITGGVQCYLKVPFAGTITSAELLSQAPAGSATVDFWKCTFAQFDGGATHPVIGDSITGGNPIVMTASTKAQDNALLGWNVNVAKDDVLAFYISSVSGVTLLTMILSISRLL